MKKLILFILLFSCLMVQGQESFKKYYRIPLKIKYKVGVINLQKDTILKFKAMSKHDQDSIKDIYPLNSKVKYTISQKIKGVDAMVQKEIIVDTSFYELQKITKEIPVTLCDLKGNVKFEKDKIIVNAYLNQIEKNGLTTRPAMYYKLQDRQSIRLKFWEGTISTIALPLKYRFRSKDGLRQSEYSTGFNGNLVGGISYGSSRFLHREEVENVTNTWKVTFAGLLGASTVSLNSSNTSLNAAPLAASSEITKGLASMGLGFTYSYNKINLGLFVGVDRALGKDADKWNYNKKPWLGVAIGYSILNL